MGLYEHAEAYCPLCCKYQVLIDIPTSPCARALLLRKTRPTRPIASDAGRFETRSFSGGFSRVRTPHSRESPLVHSRIAVKGLQCADPENESISHSAPSTGVAQSSQGHATV
jgi:hypothetical protein